jgi:hypothetical protein
MTHLNRRPPRIAMLMALALAAVALLAVSAGAATKDRGADDNGHHQGHGHHHRHFEMREAGKVASFDQETGKLKIALLGGGTLAGRVTDATKVRCESADDRRARRDHGGRGETEPGDDHGGRGETEPGDDHGGESAAPETPAGKASCSVDALVPGALVGSAELRRGAAGAVFEEIELGHHS